VQRTASCDDETPVLTHSTNFNEPRDRAGQIGKGKRLSNKWMSRVRSHWNNSARTIHSVGAARQLRHTTATKNPKRGANQPYEVRELFAIASQERAISPAERRQRSQHLQHQCQWQFQRHAPSNKRLGLDVSGNIFDLRNSSAGRDTGL